MSDINQIEIRCNPSNPVNYLACCGIFDLVSRVESAAEGRWLTVGELRFVLETAVPDKEVVATLVDALSSEDRWRFITSGESKELSRIEVTFQPPDSRMSRTATGRKRFIG
jgi:CRISPR-associated protein Csb3